MTTVDDLHAKGLIEPVEFDRSTADQWLSDAARHLKAAAAVTDLDPAGAYVLAYDAARKGVAAALLATGYRVRSRPGSHHALAQFAVDLAHQTGEPALERLDRLRRNRNRSEYGSRSFGQAEVAEAIACADAIVTACGNLR